MYNIPLPTQLSPSGEHVWFNWFGGTILSSDTWDLAVAPAGWSVGIFNFRDGSMTLGSITISATVANKYYLGIYKQDADGNVLWVKTWSGTDDIQSYAVALDSSGQIAVGGRFRGSFTFGSATLTSTGSTDNLVFKMTTDGDPLWGSGFGGTGQDQVNIHSIAFDYFSSIYATGWFYNQMTVEGTTYNTVPSGTDNGYIVKYSSSGSIQWITTVEGSFAAGGGMTVDGSNNPVAAGTGCPSAKIGSITVTTGGTCGIYVTTLQGAAQPTAAPTPLPQPDVAQPVQIVARERVALTERALPSSYYHGVPAAADNTDSCFAGEWQGGKAGRKTVATHSPYT